MHTTKESLQVLFEDNHIIVVNKRCGDITQGDKTGDAPLSDIIKEYLKEKRLQNKESDIKDVESLKKNDEVIKNLNKNVIGEEEV